MLGWMNVTWDHGRYMVANTRVNATVQRCGVGTKLYEAAAQFGCTQLGAPLRSDYGRSAAAQSFWEKQVKKGRATCAKWIAGEVEAPDTRESAYGRGNCDHYVLTCPIETLSRRRRRSRTR